VLDKFEEKAVAVSFIGSVIIAAISVAMWLLNQKSTPVNILGVVWIVFSVYGLTKTIKFAMKRRN
jgi:hypothetical protein